MGARRRSKASSVTFTRRRPWAGFLKGWRAGLGLERVAGAPMLGRTAELAVRCCFEWGPPRGMGWASGDRGVCEVGSEVPPAALLPLITPRANRPGKSPSARGGGEHCSGPMKRGATKNSYEPRPARREK